MGNGVADSSSGGIAGTKRRSLWANFFVRLVREKPLGTIGLIITLILLFAGIFANFIAPYGFNEQFKGDYLLGSTAKYWLGTDNLGRDMFSRIIFGARISLIIGLAATSVGTFGSVIIGGLSGYIGGKFDLIVQRFVDGVMAMPGLILLIAIMSLIEPGMLPLIIVMGGLGAVGGSRFPRSVVISIKENVYVQAAVAIGCPTSRILTRHILPNIMAPIIISFTTSVPGVILGEASLSFLGYGIPPPQPSWGGMLSVRGRKYMFKAPMLAIWPGLALSIVVYGINMFGDAVRDLMDPRLRGGAGRFGVRAKKEKPQ